MLQRIHDAMQRAARVAVWLGGGALTVCAVLITVDVFCRKIFSISIGGSDEITAYVFAASTTWAFSYCLLHRANIRIDAVYNRLPAIPRSVIDIASLVMLLIFAGILTERAAFTLTQSIVNQSSSITPLGTRMWIPQSFWVAGWLFFLVTLVFVLLQALIAWVHGDAGTITRIAGLRTTEEEVKAETQRAEPTSAGRTGDGP